jgi:hypothetical protein
LKLPYQLNKDDINLHIHGIISIGGTGKVINSTALMKLTGKYTLSALHKSGVLYVTLSIYPTSRGDIKHFTQIYNFGL